MRDPPRRAREAVGESCRAADAQALGQRTRDLVVLRPYGLAVLEVTQRINDGRPQDGFVEALVPHEDRTVPVEGRLCEVDPVDLAEGKAAGREVVWSVETGIFHLLQDRRVGHVGLDPKRAGEDTGGRTVREIDDNIAHPFDVDLGGVRDLDGDEAVVERAARHASSVDEAAASPSWRWK